ncbi:MAG TPA: hypothetical protein VFD38_00335 [Myxococcaceae bacterium]|nr:hypothetical protein [Myxococcaceae bacterium]
MKKVSFHAISAVLALAVACGAGQDGVPGTTSNPLEAQDRSGENHKGPKKSGLNCGPVDFGQTGEIEEQLEIAHKSICRYRRIEAALAAGYHDSGLPCEPGQGYHFIKDELVGTTDIRHPSVLMYTKDGDLNSPEWIAPQDAFPEPPSIFGRTMHSEDELGLWILHVWVWKQNSNGVFDDHNPNVTCP